MRKMVIKIAVPLSVLLIMLLSIWGPETLAEYKDKAILDEIHAEAVETEGEGYRYKLSSNEKLYILSECLNSQTLPESEQNALTKIEAADGDYQELGGTYAFIVNHRGPSGREITDKQIYETCNSGLAVLKELNILPASVKDIEAEAYEAVLYSAIDVLEPQNNVAVWKLSLSNSQKNANKENRLIDVYIDADDGKIYEFYARTELSWEKVNPDEIIEAWSEYLGLGKPAAFESENPLLEMTPYYKKYVFAGMGGDRTIVTVGFYEGINELFLKISR